MRLEKKSGMTSLWCAEHLASPAGGGVCVRNRGTRTTLAELVGNKEGVTAVGINKVPDKKAGTYEIGWLLKNCKCCMDIRRYI